MHHQYPKCYHAFCRKKKDIDSKSVRIHLWGFFGSYGNQQHWNDFQLYWPMATLKYPSPKVPIFHWRRSLLGHLFIYVEKKLVFQTMCIDCLENVDPGYLILVFHCLWKILILSMYAIDTHADSILSSWGSIVFLTHYGKTSFPSVCIFVSMFLIYKHFCCLDSLSN